ncbi:asparagine synthase (glutamine-hydrolyzing) [Halobacteriovorax marinus]|nr:asparagine synthase (glutamine-hydrolyzing) [Halobacteriovorax marinus]
MCGISGFIDFNKELEINDLVSINDALLSRGPDDSGTHFENRVSYNIGLGHRRLSIIDLSLRGHQPMSNVSDDVIIVYNGEVYNYLEVRDELIQLGESFYSDSDTEVILKAYEVWGIDSINKFIGMFAYVIYDKRKEFLYVARDRVGVKPLYYTWKDGTFLFTSELKSFKGRDFFRKEINLEAVAEFFSYGYIKSPKTIFNDTYKLSPGSYITLDLKERLVTEHTYWALEDHFNKAKFEESDSDSLKKLEETLISSFRYRTISDVPIGVFLSGGYDSTAVAALLKKYTSSDIKTFTIGFDDERFNEARYAKQVATHIGTDHSEYYCSEKDAIDLLNELPRVYDEPFGDSSAIPTMLLAKFTRENVKVALSADGGDEIFSGYPSYAYAEGLYKLLSVFPNFIVFIAAKIIHSLGMLSRIVRIPIYNLSGKLFKVSELLSESNCPAKMYDVLGKYFYTTEVFDLVNYKYKNNYQSPLVKQDSIVQDMLFYSIKSYLVDNILKKVDMATMSYGLEGREPFLDHRLIELAAQMKVDFKQKGGVAKWPLRQIVHKYVPTDLMERQKMGFSVPMENWLRGELRSYIDRYLSRESIEKHKLLNYSYVNHLKVDFYKNNGNPYKLWLILVFQMWHKEWYE